jgi:hypothetical protein
MLVVGQNRGSIENFCSKDREREGNLIGRSKMCNWTLVVLPFYIELNGQDLLDQNSNLGNKFDG